MPRIVDPFKDLERLFTQSLQAPHSAAVPMDLYKEGDYYKAEIDLPGVDPASIDIDIEDRTITVRAERRARELGGEDSEWVSRERYYGTFARRITVGSGLALDQVSASYIDGVLTLTIPVAEEAKPRKVAVTFANPTNLGQVGQS